MLHFFRHITSGLRAWMPGPLLAERLWEAHQGTGIILTVFNLRIVIIQTVIY